MKFATYMKSSLVAAVAVVGLQATVAHATAIPPTDGTFIETVSPNDVFPGAYNGSPALWKCDDVPEGANPSCTSVGETINGYTYSGVDFTITFDYAKMDDGQPDGWIGGTWTYNGTGPLKPSYLSIKASNVAEMWDISGLTTGNWSTETDNLGGKGLSHLSFWDTEMPQVPVPAAGLLLIGGLGALGALRRRRKS